MPKAAAHVEALKDLLCHVPLDEAQQQKAEDLVKQCSTEELVALGLGPPPRPEPLKGLGELSIEDKLRAVQCSISGLHYHHRPGYLFNVSKTRPLCRILDTARDVLRESLPIKCIEAVFVGLYLTSGWAELERLPLRFRSRVGGQEYRHIVLAVHHAASRRYGALGLSRRPELMDKPLAFASLSALVTDYKQAYEKWGHTLVKVKLGLPVEHDRYYEGPVCWDCLSLRPDKHSWSKLCARIDEFAEHMRRQAARFKTDGRFASPYKKPSSPSRTPLSPSKATARQRSLSVPLRSRQAPEAGQRGAVELSAGGESTHSSSDSASDGSSDSDSGSDGEYW